MTAPTIRRLSSRDPEFLSALDALLHFDNRTDEVIESTVAEVLANVEAPGQGGLEGNQGGFDELVLGFQIGRAGIEAERSIDVPAKADPVAGQRAIILAVPAGNENAEAGGRGADQLGRGFGADGRSGRPHQQAGVGKSGVGERDGKESGDGRGALHGLQRTGQAPPAQSLPMSTAASDWAPTRSRSSGLRPAT